MAVNDRRYGLTVIYFIGSKITGKSFALLLTGNVNLIIVISETAINNICHKKLCSCIFQNVAFCSQKHPTEKSGVSNSIYFYVNILSLQGNIWSFHNR